MLIKPSPYFYSKIDPLIELDFLGIILDFDFVKIGVFVFNLVFVCVPCATYLILNPLLSYTHFKILPFGFFGNT